MAPSSPLDRRSAVALGATGAALSAALLAPDPAWGAAALITWAVLLWSTALASEAAVALGFFALTLLSGVAEPETVFAGFQAGALWLVFAGLVLAQAAKETGLGAALAGRAIAPLRSRRGLVWAAAGVGLGLAFLIPSSMARVLLLAPLTVAACDRLGLGQADPLRPAAGLAAVLGTSLPAGAILTATAPNLIWLGAAETLHGATMSYGGFLALHGPVLGLGAFLSVGWLCARRVAPGPLPRRTSPLPRETSPPPQETSPPPGAAGPGAEGAFSPAARRLGVVLLGALALWTTDALHGLPPARIGLAAAALALAPGIGALEASAIGRLNVAPWLFVAGVVALGSVAEASGLAERLGAAATAIDLAALPEPARYAVMVGLGMAAALLVATPATPSLLTPLAPALAASAGWPLEAALAAQIPAFMLTPFAYQIPPVLVGAALAGASPRAAGGVLLRCWAVGVLALAPLHYLWARALGVFG